MDSSKEQTSKKFDHLIRLAMELDPEVIGQPYENFIPEEIIDALEVKNRFEDEGRVEREDLQNFNDIYKHLQRQMRTYIEKNVIDPEHLIERGLLKRKTLKLWQEEA